MDHPDYPEVLQAKDHSKGDPRQWIDSNIGVTISDAFMEDMIENGGYKQELFGETLRTRLMSGSPYMVFIDNVNRQNPDCYKERNLNVSLSNLCSEIVLYTDENHTFVCVLSSMNLSRWFEWKDWRSPRTGRSAPEIAIHLLEAVVTEFIKKAEHMTGMGRAVRFAKKSRALGLGTMGLHSLYQSQMLPFKSKGARELNIETHKFIREQADKASRELAVKFGEPEWCVGSGFRHSHRLAIAPTKTNSVISGAFSEGVAPADTNYYVAKQDKGTFVRKNPHLEKLFCERNIGSFVWDKVDKAKGSVKTLDCLSDFEKEVFLTAREIDQFEIIKQASDRQQFICQAQSINLFLEDPEVSAEYLLRLHISAWKAGLKSLYYLKAKSALIANELEEDMQEPAIVITKEGCPWCVKLKEELAADGLDFTEVSLNEAKEEGMWSDNWTTVPQLYLQNNWIGGYTDYITYKELNTNATANAYEDSNNPYKECQGCEA
jgi:ribonucleoside-diphosphate reductase alpha chain